MTVEEDDGVTAIAAMGRWRGSPEVGDSYAEMVDGLRDFLDAVAGARMSADKARELRAALEGWTSVLRAHEVGESERVWGHLDLGVGRGQGLAPRVFDGAIDGFEFTAKAVFGRYYVGENGAVHGGAISLLLDEVLGMLLVAARLPPSRTAFLRTHFRSVTPVGETLVVRGRIDRVEGRKRFLSAELLHGDMVCAEVDGLWIALKRGQQ